MRDSVVSELVKTAYNSVATSYEEDYSEIDASDRIYWGTFVTACQGKQVLDIGCGIGHSTLFLLEKGLILMWIDFLKRALSREIELVNDKAFLTLMKSANEKNAGCRL